VILPVGTAATRLVVFCLKKGYDTFEEQQAVSGLEKERFD